MRMDYCNKQAVTHIVNTAKWNIQLILCCLIFYSIEYLATLLNTSDNLGNEFAHKMQNRKCMHTAVCCRSEVLIAA
jgi:hypothetical protein